MARGQVNSPPKCLDKVKDETHGKNAAAPKVCAAAVATQEDPAPEEGEHRRRPRPPEQAAKGQERHDVDDNVGYGGCPGLVSRLEYNHVVGR